MKKYLLLLPTLLIACTAPNSAAQDVYAAESTYAVALRAELAYSSLPRCPAAKLCSDVSVIKKIRSSDDIAWKSIQDAQTAVRVPGFGHDYIVTTVASATALTKAFSDITAQLKVK